MNNKLIIAIVFHLMFLMGILNAFFFSAFSSFNQLITEYQFDFMEILIALILVLISELLVSFRFKKFKIERKNYTSKSYLTRRLLRTFYTTGAIYYLMFNPEGSLLIAIPIIIYYVINTPTHWEFKKYTSS